MAPARQRRGSNFEIGRDSPGMPERTRFDWSERHDPPQTAPRMESRGGVRGDNTESRHFANGEPADIDAEFLLAVARAVIAMVNSREYARGKV